MFKSFLLLMQNISNSERVRLTTSTSASTLALTSITTVWLSTALELLFRLLINLGTRQAQFPLLKTLSPSNQHFGANMNDAVPVAHRPEAHTPQLFRNGFDECLDSEEHKFGQQSGRLPSADTEIHHLGSGELDDFDIGFDFDRLDASFAATSAPGGSTGFVSSSHTTASPIEQASRCRHGSKPWILCAQMPFLGVRMHSQAQRFLSRLLKTARMESSSVLENTTTSPTVPATTPTPTPNTTSMMPSTRSQAWATLRGIRSIRTTGKRYGIRSIPRNLTPCPKFFWQILAVK